MSQPDHRRIHELEHDLGFRDDPPPPPVPTDEPGAVIYYRPQPESFDEARAQARARILGATALYKARR